MAAIGKIVGRTGISPNALTLIGLGLNVGAAAIICTGDLLLGGIAFLVASGFDMVDGAVARATGQTSRFGAFLDSVVDRWDEGVVFVALLVVAGARADTLLVAATGATLVGSLLVSYTRARAEGLGLDCEVGWLQRPERVILLGAGMIVAQLFSPFLLTLVMGLLALATNLTAVQRMVYVYRLLATEQTGTPTRSE
jgi:CDP-diacylglycerol--glycerol-3-phosphate 3-phosphatidyltransferase